MSLLIRTSAAQSPQVIRPLILKQEIEDTIKGGEKHLYQIEVTASQFLHAIVEQRGIDVTVALIAPDGKKLFEVDAPTGMQGPEQVLFLASVGGVYRLEITAPEKALPGTYAARVEALRFPTEKDHALLNARNLYDEGQRLQARNSAEAIRQAAVKYGESLPLFRVAEDTAGEAAALSSLGFINLQTASYQRAIDYFQKALPLWEAQNNQLRLAFLLNSLGGAYDNIGNKDRALESYLQALPFWRAIGNRQGEAATLHNLGAFYDSIGRGREARKCYEDALTLIRAVGDRASEARILNNLAGHYRDADERIATWKKALELHRAAGNRRGEAQVLHNLGWAQYEQGDKAAALATFEQVLPMHRAFGNARFEATTLGSLGILYLDYGDIEKAEAHFQQALNIGQTIGDSRIVANTYSWLSRVAAARRRFDEALQHSESCLRILESVRTTLAGTQLRATFTSTSQRFYQLSIDLLMQVHQQNPGMGLVAQALQVSERARARGLIEDLAEAKVELHLEVPVSLLERERLAQERLNNQAFRHRQLLLSKKITEAAEAAKAIETTTGELQQAQAEIRKTSPRYAALTQPQPLTAEQIQRELLDDDTLLLEYSLGESRSYLWAVTPTSLTSYELPGRAEIEAQAAKVYDLLTARNRHKSDEAPRLARANDAEADAKLPEQAAALSRIILAPVAAQLGKKRLIVVAQGKLQFIPFGVLPEPETAPGQPAIPLIVNHVIVHLPSASTLAVLRRETAGRTPAAKTIALVADPVFEPTDERLKKTIKPNVVSPVRRSPDLLRAVEAFGETGDQIRFPRLKGTGDEADLIAKTLPAAQVLKAKDFAASRATALSGELSNYRIVHFATHGFLHSEHPELSGLVLSLLDEQGREQDGFLRLNQIYNMKLSADLVVLSACRTGLGAEVKGEGMMSLARGFMYAGAPRLVVSAWDVQDRASAVLMDRFYKHLFGKTKPSPAAALREAQLEMLRERQFAAPYFWGGFVLQGEWR